MQETWVRSLGQEDSREEGLTTHSSILAWRIPMDRGAWWATVHGVAKSQTWLKWLSMYTHTLVGIKKEKNFAFWKVKEFEVNGEKYWVSFFILLPINDTLKICMQSRLLRLGDNSAGLSSLWYEYTEGIWQFSINTLFEVTCFSVILKCSLLLRPQRQLLHFI